MSISLSIDLGQLKSLILQCKPEEKIELVRLLEEETFPSRFRQFLSRIKTDDLSMEEITSEVETVRQQRYDAKKAN